MNQHVLIVLKGLFNINVNTCLLIIILVSFHCFTNYKVIIILSCCEVKFIYGSFNPSKCKTLFLIEK
jgi:hypothetical protein